MLFFASPLCYLRGAKDNYYGSKKTTCRINTFFLIQFYIRAKR